MIPSRERSVIGQFLSDESNAFVANADCVSGVFFPECESDIIGIMRDAAGSGARINTSGAGTGITGSRVPVNGGFVISMGRMLQARKRDDCREIAREGLAGRARIYLDETEMLAHVPPGISLSELASMLPHGIMYPPDPTESLASVGGTVATNASGARCFFHGPTRRWVEGLRLVLADGEVLDIRRGQRRADDNGAVKFESESGKKYSLRIPDYIMPEVKSAAGLYSKPGMDLIDLFIGSEGILGIFSEVTLRLRRVAGETTMTLAFFADQKDVMRFADTLRGMKERGVLAIEYFDGNALGFIRGEHPDIPEGAGAAILAELETGTMDIMEELVKVLAGCNSMDDWCASNGPDRRRMREFRHSLPDSVNTYLRQHDSYKLGTDFAVPEGGFPAMMGCYAEAGRAFESRFPREGAHWVMFGHIGDCHVHFNFITASPEERAHARALYTELAMYAMSLGGTVSAEHGVGKKTVQADGSDIPYLQLMYGERGLREISRVKSTLDPHWLLNPGNMIPMGHGQT